MMNANVSTIVAVIIDDERDAREALRTMLEKYCPNLTIAGEADSISSGQALVESLDPQLIFLDVEMPPRTGFELLKGLNNFNGEVIFTTAHDHYAIHAIKVSALDYLLKPIDKDELVGSVAKIQEKQVRATREVWDLLRSQLESKQTKPERLVIASLDGYEIIKTDDILYCEGNGNYTSFYIKDHPPLIASKILKEYERLLPPPTFLRVHAKHLVNINFIKRYQRGRGGTLIMTDGKQIEVSQNRKQDLLIALGH